MAEYSETQQSATFIAKAVVLYVVLKIHHSEQALVERMIL